MHEARLHRARLVLFTLPALLLVLGLYRARSLALFDNAWIDFCVRNGRPTVRDPRIALVYLTDETRQKMGYPPNLPRAELAAFLRKLFRLGARVVLLDIFLAPAPNDPGETEVLAISDERLPVAFISTAVFDYLQSTPRFLAPLSGRLDRPHDHLAHFSVEVDADGVLRGCPLGLEGVLPLRTPLGEASSPTRRRLRHLALEGVNLGNPELRIAFLEPSEVGAERPWYLAPGGAVSIGDTRVYTFGPDHRVYPDVRRVVNAAGQLRDQDSPEGEFQKWKFEEVMRFQEGPNRRVFEGCYVIVGSEEVVSHDAFSTALGRLPGPWFNAQVLSGLLDNRFLLPVGAPVVVGLCVLLWALGVWIFVRLSPVRAGLVAAGLACAVLCVGAAAHHLGRLWLPISAPILTVGLTYAIIAVQVARRSDDERRFIRGTLARYAPHQVVEMLLADPSRLRLGGEAHEVTVLFADINGFTSITEEQGPEATIEMLNACFERLTEVVFRHEGLVKQFVGDEIMVIFGAPLECEDHAVRAIAAAWDMRAEMARLSAEREAAGKIPFDLKFGVNSGRVVLGNIGSHRRVEYGAVGDPVNAASRIMALNKGEAAGITTKILVGARTVERGGADWRFREVGTFIVPGKRDPIQVYELLGPRDGRGEGQTSPEGIRGRGR